MSQFLTPKDRDVDDAPTQDDKDHPEGEGDIAPPQMVIQDDPMGEEVVHPEFEPEPVPAFNNPEPSIEGVTDFIEPDDEGSEQEAVSEARAYTHEDILERSGTEWPVHENCHCLIKQLPSGKPIWESSSNACPTCRHYERLFNAESTRLFG